MTRLILIGAMFVLASSGGCMAGDDAGPPETMRDFCWGFAEPYCARAHDCAALEIAFCEDFFMDGCCQYAGVCDQPAPPLDEGTWYQCIGEVENLPCEAVESGDLPDVCKSL